MEHGQANRSAAVIASDRAAGWRPLYPYIGQRRFSQWQRRDLDARVDEEACPLDIRLFISHRWQTPDNPDPNFETLPTIIECLSRAFMTANGFLDRESYQFKELVLHDALLLALHENELHRCTCGSTGWLELRTVLGDDDPFYELVTHVERRRAFYRLMKHVRVWYDYLSLPQARDTPEERELFDHALDGLANIVSQSEVLALWGDESVSRAWCMFEVLAARRVSFCAPAKARFDAAQRAMFKAAGYEHLAHYRGRPSPNVMIHVKALRSRIANLGEQEIEKHFRTNGIACSREEDYRRVARLTFRHLQQTETPSNWNDAISPSSPATQVRDPVEAVNIAALQRTEAADYWSRPLPNNPPTEDRPQRIQRRRPWWWPFSRN